MDYLIRNDGGVSREIMIKAKHAEIYGDGEGAFTLLLRAPLSRIFTKRIRMALFLFAGVCLYRITLDYVYFNFLTYDAEYPDNRELLSLAASWLILLASFPLIEYIVNTSERDSALTCASLYVIGYVPFTTCVYAGMFIQELVVYGFIFYMILYGAECFQLSRPIKPFPKITIGKIRFDDTMLKIVGVACFFTVVYTSWRYTGFRLHFGIYDVYDLRMEARGYNYPKLLSFMLQWARGINPIMCVYYIIKRNYLFAALFFLVQILSFGIEAHKSELFTAFLAVILYFVKRKISTRQFMYLVIWGAFGLAFLAVVEHFLLHSNTLTQLLIRRMMFVPNALHRYYYDWFVTLQHDIIYFKDDLIYFFGKFYGMTYPYTNEAIGRLIGRVYHGSIYMNANNGSVSNAMWELGGLGAFIVPFIWAFYFRLLDRSVEGLNKALPGLTTPYAFTRGMGLVSGGISLVDTNMIRTILLFSMLNRPRNKANEQPSQQ